MINELRSLINTKLNSIKDEYGIKEVAYRLASDQKMFPHIVWEITTIAPTDMGRHDFMLDIDVWGKDEETVFDIMEAVIELLAFSNDPDNNILPTFYDTSAGTVGDTDKTLVHGVIRTECQCYETGVTDDGILNPVEPEPEIVTTED